MFNSQTINKLLRRNQAYKNLFLSQDGTLNQAASIVLKDLKKFCYAEKPVLRITPLGNADPLQMAHADGRREVWLRINQMLEITDAQLKQLREDLDD